MAAHDEERVKKRKRKRTRPEQLSETKREARTHKKRRALPRLLLRQEQPPFLPRRRL